MNYAIYLALALDRMTLLEARLSPLKSGSSSTPSTLNPRPSLPVLPASRSYVHPIHAPPSGNVVMAARPCLPRASRPTPPPKSPKSPKIPSPSKRAKPTPGSKKKATVCDELVNIICGDCESIILSRKDNYP